ncbi:hypothetical protein KIW84_021885 [Lathyrus oleraceus]|uniref:Uncharacterized protein n=1 Tax=Pisum sativum TaxID=3888 RepID=A0A9D4YAA7_PEA|nr:hypothetical protein KIW84_021885 [Pisum sativum]
MELVRRPLFAFAIITFWRINLRCSLPWRLESTLVFSVRSSSIWDSMAMNIRKIIEGIQRKAREELQPCWAKDAGTQSATGASKDYVSRRDHLVRARGKGTANTWWIKRNQLSFARHVALAKFVIEALPTYTKMRIMVPKERLKKIQIDFIWVHSSDTEKIRTIRWHDICKPKNSGGLGLRHLSRMNGGCIMNMG